MSSSDYETLEGLDSLPEPAELPEEESLVSRLRKQRKEIAEQTFHDLDLPGYNGEIFVRYRLLDGTEIDAIRQKIRKTVRGRSEQVLAATLDNLITACDEVWVRDEGKEIPLREHKDFTGNRDMPVKFDSQLAEFLQFSTELPDPPTARSVVLALFGGNDLAVSMHGAFLMRWMMNSSSELDELLGGS
jgi:hypothetical protein